MPGLILDMYNGAVVMQAHSLGMHNDRHLITAALKEVLGDQVQSIFYKNLHGAIGENATEYLLGMSALPHTVMEHGNKFYIDWEEGQKTGFFLDQKNNRALLKQFSKDATILNTFCYSGGFSIYGLQAGAKLVHSVDASEKALDLLAKNLILTTLPYSDSDFPCRAFHLVVRSCHLLFINSL